MDEGEPKSKSPGEEAPMLAPMIKRRCVVKVNSYWRNLGVIYKKKTKLNKIKLNLKKQNIGKVA